MDRDDARRLGASRHSVSHARRRHRRTSVVADRRWSSIGLWVFSLLLLLASSRAAACIDPEGLAHSTVGITRYFSGDDAKEDSGLLGIRGTAWFLSATSMVTAEHVAAAMGLSNKSWKQIELRERENKQSITVRIQRVAGAHAEKLVVLELQTQFSGAQALQIRMRPLAPEERVVSSRIPRQSIALRRGSIRTLWRQRKPCRHGAARDVRRGQSSRARSRCIRCPGAGLRGSRGRHRQQHLHTNPAASVSCDAGLDSLGESQRRCRAQSGLGGFVADRRHGEPHWRDPIGSTQALPATDLVVDDVQAERRLRLRLEMGFWLIAREPEMHCKISRCP